MPPLKVPKCPVNSLTTLAMDASSLLISNTCYNIQMQYGTYDNSASRDVVENLNEHLLDKIPPCVLDMLCETTVKLQPLKHADLCATDRYIVFSSFMHSKMRIFKPIFNSPQSLLLRSSYDYFINNFSKLAKIVELDIGQLDCSDKMLIEIGKTCKNLQVIIMQSNNHIDSRCIKKLILTGEGLSALVQCPELRVIKDVGHNSNDEFQTVDISCVKNLLKTLTKLEVFNYKYMDRILSRDMKNVGPLNLTYLEFFKCNVRAEEILAITKLFPKLNHVKLNYRLSHPFLITLDALAKSDITLDTLDFLQFPFPFATTLTFIGTTSALFAAKGQYINSLKIVIGSDCGVRIGLSDIVYIGQLCPNINNLSIYCSPNRWVDYDFQTLSGSVPNCFTHLKFLRLEGCVYHDWVFFCLKNAHSIQTIWLDFYMITSSLVNTMFSQIMQTNALAVLRSLTLLTSSRCSIAVHILRRLAQLPKLTYLTLECAFDNAASDFLQDLADQLKTNRHNVDLYLDLSHSIFHKEWLIQ